MSEQLYRKVKTPTGGYTYEPVNEKVYLAKEIAPMMKGSYNAGKKDGQQLNEPSIQDEEKKDGWDEWFDDCVKESEKPQPLQEDGKVEVKWEGGTEFKIGDKTRYGIIESFVVKDGVMMMRSKNPYGTWPIEPIK